MAPLDQDDIALLESLLQAAKPLFTAAFTLWGSPVTWLEIVGFVLAVAMVLCNWRVNPLGWPLAMVSSLLYALLFADSKLYGEAGLQLFFIAMAAWGWSQWLRGTSTDGRALEVGTLTTRQRWWCAAGVLAAWPMLALVLLQFTNSDAAWLDALPTVGSVAGTILLARKRVENWMVWTAVNIVSVALFAHKGLWLTVVLYAVFTLMALWGWRTWRGMLRG